MYSKARFGTRDDGPVELASNIATDEPPARLLFDEETFQFFDPHTGRRISEEEILAFGADEAAPHEPVSFDALLDFTLPPGGLADEDFSFEPLFAWPELPSLIADIEAARQRGAELEAAQEAEQASQQPPQPPTVIFSPQQADEIRREDERRQIERLRAEGVIVPEEPAAFDLQLDAILTFTGLKVIGLTARFIGRTIIAPALRFALRKSGRTGKAAVRFGRFVAGKVTEKASALKEAAVAKGKSLVNRAKDTLAEARKTVAEARRKIGEAVSAARRRIKRFFGFGDEAAATGGKVTSGADKAGRAATRASRSATFGRASTSNFRKTFFNARPDLQGKVVVHHAVEQQVLNKYPGIVTQAEIHSLENLRGIPVELNPSIHLSRIRRLWNELYRTHPTVSKEQLLEQAAKIDDIFSEVFQRP